MLILAIETATQQVGCALLADGELLATHEVVHGRRHAENLVPAIEFVCGQTETDLHALSAIAVDVGPGLFTGMRVGIATAKAIGWALSIPVVPVCSLDVLAHVRRHERRTIATVIDARRGEVYYALHVPDGTGARRVTDPAVGTVDDLVELLLGTDDDIALVGDGAVVHADRLSADAPRAALADRAEAHPRAGSLALVAGPMLRAGRGVDADRVEPMYLRRPDAEINWQSRDGAVR